MNRDTYQEAIDEIRALREYDEEMERRQPLVLEGELTVYRGDYYTCSLDVGGHDVSGAVVDHLVLGHAKFAGQKFDLGRVRLTVEWVDNDPHDHKDLRLTRDIVPDGVTE